MHILAGKFVWYWAIRNKKALAVAEFIYEHIYCRYLAPGECIIHDHGGEFNNNLLRSLAKDFGVDMRLIKAGRPMSNGQGEAAVKLVKQKLKNIAE